MLNFKLNRLSVQILSGLALGVAAIGAQATALDGRLYVDGFTSSDTVTASGSTVSTYSGGSYFAMGSNNPNGQVGKLQPDANGGYIELGSYQNYVTSPDVPHPTGWLGDTNGDGILEGSAGAGYSTTLTSAANIFAPFSFFGVNTYVGTLPVSYQSGEAKAAPMADVDLGNCAGTVCAMTADMSSWEVFWNGNSFEQGPRPVNTGGFVLATGTLDLVTGDYVLDWSSQIKNGPFNGVKGFWHLEGTYVPAVPVPAAAWLFGSGLLGLVGVARRKAKS